MGNDEQARTDADLGTDLPDTITLTFEDGSEAECFVWGFAEVEGKSYISLLPMEEDEEDEEGGCYLYQYDEDENGEPILGYIEDEALLDRVVEAFDQMFEEEENEYDEYVAEEELE